MFPSLLLDPLLWVQIPHQLWFLNFFSSNLLNQIKFLIQNRKNLNDTMCLRKWYHWRLKLIIRNQKDEENNTIAEKVKHINCCNQTHEQEPLILNHRSSVRQARHSTTSLQWQIIRISHSCLLNVCIYLG